MPQYHREFTTSFNAEQIRGILLREAGLRPKWSVKESSQPNKVLLLIAANPAAWKQEVIVSIIDSLGELSKVEVVCRVPQLFDWGAGRKTTKEIETLLQDKGR